MRFGSEDGDVDSLIPYLLCLEVRFGSEDGDRATLAHSLVAAIDIFFEALTVSQEPSNPNPNPSPSPSPNPNPKSLYHRSLLTTSTLHVGTYNPKP